MFSGNNTVSTGGSIDTTETGVSAWGTINANGLYDTALLNNTITGTTVTYAACVDPSTANSAIDCPANAAQQVLGITVSGAGTTGYPKILRLAQTTTATFVGSTTSVVGNYATTSSAIGKLLDTGSTTRPTCGNAIVGIITAVNTGTTHTVLVRPEALPPCLTGIRYANNTSADTASTSTQIATALNFNLGPVSGSVTVTQPIAQLFCTAACNITPLSPTNLNWMLCVRNDPNVSTVITIVGLSGVYYEKPDHSGWATNSNHTITTAGFATDNVCLIPRDSTHIYVMSSTNATAN